MAKTIYNFKKIEEKWQRKWEKAKIFNVKESKKKKFYVLDMFPYPSAEGLHIGHAFVFSLGDIYARFKRLQGFNVLYPIGYDSLGLPAENAAIKAKIHPEKYTKNSIANFMKQQKAMGWSYDWSRMVKSSDPDFYKWDQWIFLKMLEKGIAYRKRAPVNWCSKCKTVLANEQVVDGCCWRHESTEVEIKHLEQWFLKITKYADELLENLNKIDWPQRAKTMQRNWIGKSYGTEIDFEIEGKKWPIFTTRPDTVYGVTFMVVSAQHPRLMEIVTEEQKKETEKFLKKIKSVSQKELEKEGVFTGSYAVNPMNGEKVPVYAGNFVVADYGSGMVMAVPAHDQRDFEFATKYNISMKVVIEPKDFEIYERKGQLPRAYTGEGFLINSGEFNGTRSKEAIERITKHLERKKIGRKTVQFKLRDWLISRQRYWGTPIPVVYCEECGIIPVPEKELPIKLPMKVKFGKGNPLETNKKWVDVKCSKCNGNAKRETDTMDTFANSSWYYLRYIDPKNNKKIFDSKKAKYWAPIDQYIGGPEHITGHLMYFRFYTKFLRDIGLLNFDEPALKYFTQGIVHGSDGEKMSKSKGNVIEPLNIIKKYGADALRLYLISSSSSDKNFDWDDKGIQGSFKFINKVYDYFTGFNSGKSNPLIESKLNQTILDVTDYIGDFKHNFAVIKIRELFSRFSDKKITKSNAETFLKILHVYCPFVTEELWEKLENKKFLSLSEWPIADEKKIDEKLEKQEQDIDNLVRDVNNILGIVKTKPKKAMIYVMPNEKDNYVEHTMEIGKRTELDIEVYAVNDKGKRNPENKSKKAKPGKPAIYLE
ncbi:MAG TPA: leucine--tRNA ligase [Candidatus Pacearchaeota archaeon]|nr:leucine--tRNA ligase [Candidatus Pacearchaeota archaeon]